MHKAAAGAGAPAHLALEGSPQPRRQCPQGVFARRNSAEVRGISLIPEEICHVLSKNIRTLTSLLEKYITKYKSTYIRRS